MKPSGVGECWSCEENGGLKCEDNVGCLQCQSGYYLFNSEYYGWVCSVCPDECQTCSDWTTCQECNEGYKIVNGTCKSGRSQSGLILSVSSYLSLLFVCGLLLL